MKEHTKKLGEMEIKKLFLSLGVPATIGMMANALYNLIDTFYVGKGAGIEALGAMAIAFPIQIIIIAIGLMIGAGASSIIGMYLGAGEVNKADKVVTTSYISGTIVGLITTILGFIFIDQMILSFGATKSMIPLTKDYLGIILLGNVFVILSIAITNIIRAEGNAKEATRIMIAGILINLVLDPIFIFDWGFNLGLKGAAIATVLGYIGSLFMILMYIKKHDTVLKSNPFKFGFDKKEAKRITLIGAPSLLRNIVGSLIAIMINFAIQVHTVDPEMYISIFGTVNKVLGFILMPSFGMIQGLGPIISFNYGAKAYDRVIEATKLGLKFMVIYFTIGTLILILTPDLIISLFVQKDMEGAKFFIHESGIIIRIISLMLPIFGIKIVASFLYQSIGKAKESLFLTFSSQGIIVLLLLFLPDLIGVKGIWITYPISDLIAGIIAILFIVYEFKQIEKLKEVV